MVDMPIYPVSTSRSARPPGIINEELNLPEPSRFTLIGCLRHNRLVNVPQPEILLRFVTVSSHIAADWPV